jgi:hypothetical protein
VTRPERGSSYLAGADLADEYLAGADLAYEPGWIEDLPGEEFADVLRSTLREDYAGSSDEEMADALDNVLDAMSPAEAFNFGSAFNQIGKSASRLASDPAFIQIARTAAPIAGGALGTLIGGPVGTALGSKLGTLAANALPAPAAAPAPAPPPAAAPTPAALAVPVPAVAAPAVPVPAVAGASLSGTASPPAPALPPPPAIPAPVPGSPMADVPAPSAGAALPSLPAVQVPASPVLGGSAAAAQGLVLTQQPEVLRCLLATALGEHGRQRVSGVPVARLLALLSQVFAQAAADADQLMYLQAHADAAESVPEDGPPGPVRSLYADLLGADNLELAEAPGWDEVG